MLDGCVTQASVRDASVVVDMGCGTGVITRHLGAMFPSAQVYGVDLSPVPPHASSSSPPPANVRWVQGNIRDLMLRDPRFAAGSVDYAFHRLLICGMRDWQGYVDDVASMLRPGGWAELQDVDYVFYGADGERIDRDWGWVRIMRDLAEELGLDIECGSHMAAYMRKAGLVDISVREYRWPFGPDKRGNLGQQAGIAGVVTDLMPRMLAQRGYDAGQIAKLEVEWQAGLAGEEGKHWKFIVTTGRKPEERKS